MSRAPLRTSREVYQQLRWDPRFDPRRIVIGVETRLDGMKELGFGDFVPDGDVPWHRVWYFRDDQELLWDRRNRVDRLLDRRPAEVRPTGPWPALAPLPIHHFDGSWRPVTEPPRITTGAALTVLSWNVLRDPEGALDTPARTARLLDVLATVDADVLALQEVTPALLAVVLGTPHLQAMGWSSGGPDSPTVSPYGQLLLSRRPILRLGERVLTRHKRIIVAELDGAPPITVAMVHFTSDVAADAVAIRRRELDALLGLLGDEPGPVLVVGDLNGGDDRPDDIAHAHALADAGLVDAWSALRPGEAGATFDPARNRWAAITTRTGVARRLDRVLTRGPLHARAIELVGGSDPPSDHFGLRCRLTSDTASAVTADDAAALDSATPVHRAALVIIPPPALWPPIQALRAAHDRHAERWMPHITLLYGFVPEDVFDAAAARLEAALAATTSFTVELAALDHFDHRASSTIWARPDAADDALRRVQAIARRCFPQCDEQDGHGGAFTPHLTLGQATPATAVATRARWCAAWTPLRFEVGEVALISRRGDQPFAVRRTVALGGDPLARWLREHATPSPAEQAGRDRAVAVVASIAGAPRLIGSSALGVALPDSDVDLLLEGDRDRAAAVAHLAAGLATAATHVRVVTDALNPVVMAIVDGVHVDVLYCATDAVDPASQRARRAVTDLEAVRAAGVAALGEARFVALLRAVRAWARARGLDAGALGFVGGLGWAVLVAAVAGAALPDDDLGALLEHAFLSWADWPWPAAIGLGDPAAFPAQAHDVLPVLTPSAPPGNIARSATRSTRAVLLDEWRRAAELAASARRGLTPWAQLFAPLPPLAGADRGLLVELTVDDPADLDQLEGWLIGHATRLLLALERDPALIVRPVPGLRGLAGGGRGLLIGLAGVVTQPPELAAAPLRAALEGWAERPAGARVRVIAGSRAALLARLA